MNRRQMIRLAAGACAATGALTCRLLGQEAGSQVAQQPGTAADSRGPASARVSRPGSQPHPGAQPGQGEAGNKVVRTTLGLVIYCCGLRQAAEQRGNGSSDLFEPTRFLEHARCLGAGGVQVALGVKDAEYLRALREKCEQYGMFLEAIIAPPADAADMPRFEAQMRTAAQAGARAVRSVLIPGRRYERFASLDEFRQFEARAVRSLQLAAPVAERLRLPLAVENHKDHRLDERIALLRKISSPWVGACVDTGNNLALLDDPLEVVRGLAPWAVAVHLKDQAVAEDEEGFLLGDVPLGEGVLPLGAMVDVLRKARPDVRFCLELITRDALRVPCLTEGYWTTLRHVPGCDLARTLRLVRSRGRPMLLRVSSLSADEQVACEDDNLRRSLAWARRELGL